MEVRIPRHTLDRAKERGTDDLEIQDVVNTGHAVASKYGRQGKAKVFRFDAERLGRHYEHKRVEVHYVVEDDVAVTVTVYVFYGRWEE